MRDTPFSSLGASASGMRVYQTWINALSDNVANISTVNPAGEAAFQERYVNVRSAAGGQNAGASGGGAGAGIGGRGTIGDGSYVASAEFGSAEGRMVYQPDHPYADENGMVRMPDMDLSTQMTNLIIAQRAYQANVTAFERARDSYLRALEIGN